MLDSLLIVLLIDQKKRKTQLVSSIGEKATGSVIRLLERRTLDITLPLGCQKEVLYSKRRRRDQWKKNDYVQRISTGETTAEKVENSFRNAFAEGFFKVVMITTDCYELNTEIIVTAFEQLNKVDFIIGPTSNGKLYLIGMKKKWNREFSKIDWSSENAVHDLMLLMEEKRKSFGVLAELKEIDTYNDLKFIIEKYY